MGFIDVITDAAKSVGQGIEDIGQGIGDEFAHTEELEWVNETEIPVVVVEYFRQTAREWWVLQPREKHTLPSHIEVDIRVYAGEKEPETKDIIESVLLTSLVEAVEVAVAVAVAGAIIATTGPLALALVPIAESAFIAMEPMIKGGKGAAESALQDALIQSCQKFTEENVNAKSLRQGGQNIRIVGGPKKGVDPKDWHKLGFSYGKK